VSKIQEYDLEIKPAKITKGQDLAKMLTKSNEETIRMGENDQVNVVLNELEHDEWYSKF
jgi:phenylpyruvate tautomerase PptA (4-oxalocrotonate tautomerase family)